MADLTKRVLDDCDDDGEKGERGERGRRGHRGHRGRDGSDGDTGATGPTGSAGATGATGPSNPTGGNLFQFSGTVDQTTSLVPPGSNFSDGGVASLAFGDFALTGGPFPAYPLAQSQTISSLAVNIFANVNFPNTSTLSFQLVTVPDDASGPETLIGSPVSFAAGFAIGSNITERVVFAPVVLDPGVRLGLRVSAEPSPPFSVNATLLVAATAG